jgi:ubiquinone/menaquinone biosynthesis C-methylase UbiE
MNMTISGSSHGMENPTLQKGSKSNEVRRVFENAPRYLNSRRVDMRVRKETVKTFASRVGWQRLLDVGCGDGTISLPLLTHSSDITLLDLSSSMVARARANVPEEYIVNVNVRNENFMTALFEPGSFDLIVSVGVLAHVDSPEEFIAKVTSLIRPGGGLIIEFTDCRHIVGQIGRVFGRLKEFIAPSKYPTNRLSFGTVAPMFSKYNLKLVSIFRYARLPIPGIERILPDVIHHKLVDLIFGRADNNSAVWLGNEYICLLTLE